MATAKSRYCVQWDDHARHMCSTLCSLLEHKSFVDVTICCGSKTLQVHKCVLAANSPFFREELEKNSTTEQIIIGGLNFAVVKSIVEFMYCGETEVLDEHLKYIIAAAKLFQMRGLKTLMSDRHATSEESNDDNIHIPTPIFVTKKPNYSATYGRFNNPLATPQTSPVRYKKLLQKEKYYSDVEKACAKEATASRIAVKALQKELLSTSEITLFEIEDSCTETTVENFIPHTNESCIDTDASVIDNIENRPIDLITYVDSNTSVLKPTEQIVNVNKSNSVVYQEETPSDAIKQILVSNIPNNVAFVLKTNDGRVVDVTDEVLQNLSEGTLQYQFVNEFGQVGELQDFVVSDNTEIQQPEVITLYRNNEVNEIDSFPEIDAEMAKSGEKLSEDVSQGQTHLEQQSLCSIEAQHNFPLTYKPMLTEPSETQPSSSENNANSSLSDVFDVSMKSDVEDAHQTGNRKRKKSLKGSLIGSQKLQTMNVEGLNVDDHVVYCNTNINIEAEKVGNRDCEMKELESHNEMSFSPVMTTIDLDKIAIFESCTPQKIRSSQEFEDGKLVEMEKMIRYDEIVTESEKKSE